MATKSLFFTAHLTTLLMVLVAGAVIYFCWTCPGISTLLLCAYAISLASCAIGSIAALASGYQPPPPPTPAPPAPPTLVVSVDTPPKGDTRVNAPVVAVLMLSLWVMLTIGIILSICGVYTTYKSFTCNTVPTPLACLNIAVHIIQFVLLYKLRDATTPG